MTATDGSCTEKPKSVLDNPKWVNLGGTTQRALLDKYRYTNVDEDWWSECILEDFREKLKGIGFGHADCYYSLGYCQSDYATFSARVDDWAKVFKHLGLLLNWPYYEEAELSAEAVVADYRGNQRVSDYMNAGENPYDEEDDPIRFDLWEMRNAGESEMLELVRSIEALCEELSSELYRSLREEHEYLTDDERVVEYILENCQDEIEEHLLSLEDAC